MTILRLIMGMTLLVLVSIHPAESYAEADPAHKSAKVCSEELAERTDEIKKAGESPAAFFHACWTRAMPGQPTPIEANAKVEAHTVPVIPAHHSRTSSAPRARRSIVTRRRYMPIDEAPRQRAYPLVERRERFAPEPLQPAPLPPMVADTADTLGRVLRATGLPPFEVPILVPSPLRVVPVTITPR